MEKTSTREAAGFATLLVTRPQQTGQQILRNPENRLRLESQRIVSSIGRPLKCVFEVVVYRIALPLNSLSTKCNLIISNDAPSRNGLHRTIQGTAPSAAIRYSCQIQSGGFPPPSYVVRALAEGPNAACSGP
jgi:hypothetical protein